MTDGNCLLLGLIPEDSNSNGQAVALSAPAPGGIAAQFEQLLPRRSALDSAPSAAFPWRFPHATLTLAKQFMERRILRSQHEHIRLHWQNRCQA
ncbi:MAG TPA: hypothetical protein VEM40_03555 [Nitrospirota bacterium]|nr:hypothetical protein [Nitrospirota bacterium]